MGTWLHGAWKENKSFLVFIVLMFAFRSAFADWNTVPTGSMKPTIIEGDRILVNKMAYDLRLPFTSISLYQISDPVRGDIIVFDSAVTQKKMVKRVVGVPGDIIAMNDNVISINGRPLTYVDIYSKGDAHYQLERYQDMEHVVRVNKPGSARARFDTVKIPEGLYLALGDNRDNSADSRAIGFIPRNEIVGRSRSVVLSLDFENYYMPRADRFFHTL